jgi:hypothetical protein
MQQGRNNQISRHPPTASDSPYYLEGYLYGLYYRLTQIEEYISHNGGGGSPFQVCSFLRSSPPIYCIHSGSNFHGPGLQASWHATLYCF